MPISALGLSQPIGSSKEFRIIPAGKFRSIDGRPEAGKDWLLTEERGRKIIAAAAARSQDYLIDYGHLSMKKPDAIAAGWFKELTWKPDGLYVQNANWTDAAKAKIASQEFRFVSPVFSYDSASYEVLDLVSIAVTNNPALLGLTDLSSVALSQLQDGGIVAGEYAEIAAALGLSPATLAGRLRENAALTVKQGALTMTPKQLEYLCSLAGVSPEVLSQGVKQQAVLTHGQQTAGMTGRSLEMFQACFGTRNIN